MHERAEDRQDKTQANDPRPPPPPLTTVANYS